LWQCIPKLTAVSFQALYSNNKEEEEAAHGPPLFFAVITRRGIDLNSQ